MSEYLTAIDCLFGGGLGIAVLLEEVWHHGGLWRFVILSHFLFVVDE